MNPFTPDFINNSIAGKMKKVFSIIVLSLVLLAAAAFADRAMEGAKLAATINYLFSFVANSECSFIRNDKTYTPQEAVSHMKRKYAHFKDDIKSPEDFIRLSASKSLISGRPYMVKPRDGQMMKSETWLLEALKKYRQEQSGKRDADGVAQ